MTLRPGVGESLPRLVTIAGQAVLEEAEALREALSAFSEAPQPGSPAELDQTTWFDQSVPKAAERSRLLNLTMHLAVLVYANAYDHLHTLGRVLGGDGSMPLFSQATVSRVICEAAVRFAWQFDANISSDERMVRGATDIEHRPSSDIA